MEDEPLFERHVIDAGQRKRRLLLFGLVVVALVVLLFGSSLLGVYIDALWFGSLGYGDVYWYKFRLGGLLFVVFLALSILMMRLPFAALTRLLPQLREKPRLRPVSVEDLRDINFLPIIYRPGVWILSTAVGLLSAVSMSQQWPAFARYLNSTDSGVTDPIFNRDIGFYLFKLPVLDLVSGWLVTVVLILLAAIAAVSGYCWYTEKALGFNTTHVRRQAASAVSVAAAALAIVLAFSAYLARFDLLYSQHAVFAGVSYTDANVKLPAFSALMVALLVAAAICLVNAFAWRKPRLIGWIGAGVVLVWLTGLFVIPQSVYSLSVKPNERDKEAAFIGHNIEMTRRAFGLDRFDEKQFQPAATLTGENLKANQATLDNIRLWDPEVLKSTFSQNQEILTYYDFQVPDIDRYVINGELRQVMVAARELNVEQLPEKNWINQHLVYTHGYGVAMCPVNEFTAEGLPRLILKDMPVKSEVPEIKIARPEIYFGEVTDSHVYVHTRPQSGTKPEFNYPAQEQADSYSEYEADSGIPVGGLFRKTALALYLGDGTTLLLSDYITSDSRVLIRRDILERANRLAPFLLYEPDPYIVISRDGRLYWMIDAFTYSDRYPYSTAHRAVNNLINYIRNSVKVVINAYTGDTTFYVFEQDDPIIRTYQSIFPSLFRPASQMPEDLRQHVRYPESLAAIQARAYTLYHMQNSQTFYGREDLWAIAVGEPRGEKDPEPPMAPYYVLMQLPGESEVEFVSILPFTPAGPGRNNMIGWMATRSDGERYGQTVVFSFPKSLTVNGPAQIRARVNQDPQLSALMTLWSQRGSQLVRGHLLVIPIADSLLYVESFYLQAESGTGRLPELRQVAVATQDRLATAKSFDEAMSSLFPALAAAGKDALPRKEAAPTQPLATQPLAQPTGDQTGAEAERLAQQARQLLLDYERLTAEGRHREAGEKLDQLKQVLTLPAQRRGSER